MSEATKKKAFERVQMARNPLRPYTNDLLETIFEDFVEIHGDRRFSEDSAIICGFAKLGDRQVSVIGQQKGRDTNQRRYRNFGMPKPEGYRKALRLMKTAEKFGRPLITFIDTPGAYPGIDAEERGQAEAIAFNLREMSSLKVPAIVVIIGEGGSGGALAIGIGDKIIMLENAVYSVISPEGCAAILWKDAAESEQAAECLRLTAENLLDFNLIDCIISEPEDWQIKRENDFKGSDSSDTKYQMIADDLKNVLLSSLSEIESAGVEKMLELRYEKFRRMGEWLGN